MIHHLHGRLIEKYPTHVVIDCGGVGYMVLISLTTFETIPDQEDIFLHTHLVVREDSQTLYGFATIEERKLEFYINFCLTLIARCDMLASAFFSGPPYLAVYTPGAPFRAFTSSPVSSAKQS